MSQNNNIEWKQIPNYSAYYVSNTGIVYSTITKKNLTPSINKNGYLRVSMTDNYGVRKFEFVHKLVMLSFIGPRPDGLIIRHYPDQNPKNNNLNNLSYNTREQNDYDRIENGTYNQAILTENDVVIIKQHLQKGATDKDIRKLGYDISSGILSNIRHNNIWKNTGVDISKTEFRRGGGQKLTIDQVKDIKRLLQFGHSPKYIAAQFGVTASAITNIRAGRSYSDVKI